MSETAEGPKLEQKTQENQNRMLSSLGEMRRKFKKNDPVEYLKHMLKEAQIKHPKNASLYQTRAQRYLGKLYRRSLPKKLDN